MSTIKFKHPTLGDIEGLQKTPSIQQYLGLKYAEIPSRFSEPVPHAFSNASAVSYGPQAPQGTDTCENEFKLIGSRLPLNDTVTITSEADCLTLNITLPASRDKICKDLPVLVWVHGGNLQLGSASWPQYDMGHIVSTSEKIGKPIIGVSINYRVGVLGFLTSTEMLNAGYAGNYGYKDLVTAFGWIQRHIDGFGGNPDNITAIGESAGAAAVTTLLWQEEPLFNQLIAMGGSCCLIPPASMETHDSIYEKAMDLLEISGEPFEKQLAAIRTMPVEDLVSRTFQVVPALPAVDGIFIPKAHGIFCLSDPEDLLIPGKRWCKNMIIGDSKDDGVIMGLGILAANRVSSIPTTFPAHFEKAFLSDPEDLALIKEHYQIESDTPPQQAFDTLLQMSSDICFLAPTHYLAAGFPGKSYVYHFNYRNPWDGLWGGKASHILDIAVALGNYNSNGLDSEGVGVSEDMQKGFISFSNGEEPWEQFQEIGTGPVKVFSSGGGKIVTSLDEAERYPQLFDLLENVGWSKWWTAISTYLQYLGLSAITETATFPGHVITVTAAEACTTTTPPVRHKVKRGITTSGAAHAYTTPSFIAATYEPSRISSGCACLTIPLSTTTSSFTITSSTSTVSVCGTVTTTATTTGASPNPTPPDINNPVLPCEASGGVTFDVDDAYYTIDLDFEVSVYGVKSSRVFISVNGLLWIDDNAYGNYENFYSDTGDALPLSAEDLPDVAILPYWSDLVLIGASGQGIWYEAEDDSVTFLVKAAAYGSTDDAVEFTVTLGTDDKVKVHFYSVEDSSAGTVAVQHKSSGDAITYSRNEASKVHAGLSLTFDTASGTVDDN
ncbi:Lipase [Drechslerella dactyloides]|uniref:Lipase n=1 Tax=Drechslerella dactyloides TaxID=74499 RepID=A0AAD6IWQ4_DREDA|nr:Lipase [Drechslerella dactyloides]